MSRDLDQLLHDTAVVPTDLPDPSELVVRGRRRRLRRHAAGTVAGVAAAVLVGVAVLQAVPTGAEPEVLDQPPGAGHPATDGLSDGDGPETADRNALTEAEQERLEAEIAEINHRIAEAQAALEQAEQRRADALNEEAEDRADEAAAVRAELEAQMQALEARLQALLAQKAAVEGADALTELAHNQWHSVPADAVRAGVNHALPTPGRAEFTTHRWDGTVDVNPWDLDGDGTVDLYRTAYTLQPTSGSTDAAGHGNINVTIAPTDEPGTPADLAIGDPIELAPGLTAYGAGDTSGASLNWWQDDVVVQMSGPDLDVLIAVAKSMAPSPE